MNSRRAFCFLNPKRSTAPWTVCLSAAIVALNLGVVSGAPAFTTGVLGILEFDREAILSGEFWRLVTGSLVHWSLPHLLLDVGAFLAVGFLFERRLGALYPWMVSSAAVAVGVALLLCAPEVSVYRGLSGVDSGQFAVAVLSEMRRTRHWQQLVLPLLAAILFSVKLVFECTTGTMMFGTEGLGDIGIPLPLAHVAGTIGAVALALASMLRPRERYANALRLPSSRGSIGVKSRSF